MKILGILRPTDNGWVWETELPVPSNLSAFQASCLILVVEPKL